MNPIIIRERMSRDEMFKRYPNMYLLVVDTDPNIYQLNASAGGESAFVVAAFESSACARSFINEDVKKARACGVMHSDDYTEEVFSLGFCYANPPRKGAVSCKQ